MPSVSVVIPTYNAAAFIRRTLDSVLAQTRLPEEVVVVDDGSTDGTADEVERLARWSPVPLRMIRLSENSGGPARPLNAGVAAARGRLVALLDHDDVMTPRRLAEQVEAFNAFPDAGLVIGRVRAADAGRDRIADNGWAALNRLPVAAARGTAVRVAARDAAAAALRHGCYALTCSALTLPKSVWTKIGGCDERVRTACDYDLLLAATLRHDLACTSECVAEWAAPEASLYLSAAQEQLFADSWAVLQHARRLGLPRGLRSLWRREVRELMFEHGYRSRKGGSLRQAAACQFRSAWATGPSLRGLSELAKIGISGLCQFREGVR